MSLIVFVLQRKAANLERNGKREEKQEKKSHKPKIFLHKNSLHRTLIKHPIQAENYYSKKSIRA